MASRLALAILVLHGSWALGAPLPVAAPDAQPARPPCAGSPHVSQAEAIFATQLVRVCKQVSMQYVRPIDHHQLIYTAMTGLYEAARLPIPSRLLADATSNRAETLSIAKACARTAGLPSPWQAGWLAETALQAAQEEQELIELLCRLRGRLGNPESLQGRQILVVCCQALTKALDPHSGVVTAEDQSKTLGLEQEGSGVGLEVANHLGGKFLRVLAVYPGSPAQRAGLRPDDRITHLNGQPVSRLAEETVAHLLNPPMVSLTLDGPALQTLPVRVTFLHEKDISRRDAETQRKTKEGPTKAGNAPSSSSVFLCDSASLREMSLRRATLLPQRYEVEHVLGSTREEDQTWGYWVDAPNKLAHVRLASLGRGSARQLWEVLQRLHEEGLRGLVLDLRWCPGGYLDEAVDVARLFLKEGEIARVAGRNARQDRPPYVCEEPGPFLQVPLVILVNGETSGGAELIAAALQDHKRAVVCGQRTVGKGSVQEPVHLAVNPAVGIKLTAGFFLRPSGKNLQRFPQSKDSDDWGVQPQRELEMPVSTDFSKALRQWWLLQSLRPGGSNERLPLDDPSCDPQREVALYGLRELLQVKTARTP